MTANSEQWRGLMVLAGAVMFLFGLYSTSENRIQESGLVLIIVGLFCIHFTQSKELEARSNQLEDLLKKDHELED